MFEVIQSYIIELISSVAGTPFLQIFFIMFSRISNIMFEKEEIRRTTPVIERYFNIQKFRDSMADSDRKFSDP